MWGVGGSNGKHRFDVFRKLGATDPGTQRSASASVAEQWRLSTTTTTATIIAGQDTTAVAIQKAAAVPDSISNTSACPSTSTEYGSTATHTTYGDYAPAIASSTRDAASGTTGPPAPRNATNASGDARAPTCIGDAPSAACIAATASAADARRNGRDTAPACAWAGKKEDATSSGT